MAMKYAAFITRFRNCPNKFHVVLKAIAHILVLFGFLINLSAQNNTLKFNHLTANNGLPQNSVYSIVKDKYGFIWFGTWGGACRYDGYAVKVFKANEDDSTALPDNRINSIVTDSRQNVWVQTGEGKYLYKYNYEFENFSRYPIGKAPVSILKLLMHWNASAKRTAQNQSSTWVSENGSLRQINRTTSNVISYQADPANPFSLSDNQINSIFLDDCENIWIGTQNGGLNHASLTVKPFSYYKVKKDSKGLSENVVRAVCIDKKGRLWLGSENQGLTIIEHSSTGDKYTYIRDKSLNSLEIRSLYCDKQGFVWIGSRKGLVYYNPNTNRFKSCTSVICDPYVYALMEDHEGVLWVGTFKGLAWYDKGNDRFECLDPAKTTGGGYIRAIHEDSHQNLWIATEDGGLTKLIRTSFNGSTKFKRVRYVHREGFENSLINNRTYSLTEDKYGMIWVATNSGLSRLNPKNNTFKHFSVKNGLTDDLTMAVIFDGKESVWVSHKKGLTKINTRNFEIHNFNVMDGLQGNEFSQSTCYLNKANGEVFFGGINGLNSFFPDSIKINPHKPPVVFTQLSVMNQVVKPGSKLNNRVILEKSLLCSNKITLSWWDKTFRIEFAALDFANPLGNKYKYKLEGYDKDWISTDASMRTASYSNLPSGNYELKVYAANSDGVWCDAPATLRIEVLPPWWFTWWAIMFYVAIACLLLWFIYKYIVSQLEFRRNEEIHQAKLQFFTEVSHEFRTPLTLIVDPLEKLMTENPDKNTRKEYYTLMQRNARQLLLLINQLLDFRKLESGHLTLNLQEQDIVAFVRTTAATFETLAARQQIHLSIDSAVSQLNVLFDADKLTMILNNLLSNAFKFTPEQGEIKVRIETENTDNSGVLIKVSDTGAGIAADEKEKIFHIFYQSPGSGKQSVGSGVGLALTKELVQLHGGKVTVESETGKGSCFTVFLPAAKKVGMDVLSPLSEIVNTVTDTAIVDLVKPERNGKELPMLLIVDDNADIRNYIESGLKKKYAVIMASDGAKGFQQAVELLPDIIISDIMMPGTDGIELCKMLKTDERTSHIPVILLTARQSDESKVEGYETGADAYITKPFSSKVLASCIANLLEQRLRLRQLFSKGLPNELRRIAVNKTDEAFLNKVVAMIHENIEKPDFDSDMLASLLNLSRWQLAKKIKALTDTTIIDFITTVRMNKAMEYLVNNSYSISEIAYKVGYSLPTNFTRAFSKQFGVTPSAYLESLN